MKQGLGDARWLLRDSHAVERASFLTRQGQFFLRVLRRDLSNFDVLLKFRCCFQAQFGAFDKCHLFWDRGTT